MGDKRRAVSGRELDCTKWDTGVNLVKTKKKKIQRMMRDILKRSLALGS